MYSIFEKIIKQVAYYNDRPNDLDKKAIVAFYNAFRNYIEEDLGNINTENLKNIEKNNNGDDAVFKPVNILDLFYYTLWKGGGINKNLLDIFIRDLKLSLSDYLRMLCSDYYNEYAFERIKYCLDNYCKYISKIELSEIYLLIKNMIISYNENEKDRESREKKVKEKILELLIDNGAWKFDTELQNIKSFSYYFKKYFPDKIKPKIKGINRYIENTILCKYIINKLRQKDGISLKNVIHITGSNGKGSTATAIEYMLKSNGYKVNKYTNPSLINSAYMIMMDGKPISSELYEDLAKKVIEAYYDVMEEGKYKEEVEKMYNIDRIGIARINHKKKEELYTNISFQSLNIPLMYLAFSMNNADFNIVEVWNGGLKDPTNIFTEEETKATIITNIQYGIGSNDGTAKIFIDNGEIEDSNRSVAHHKTMLGKKNVPIIVANQFNDSLAEIRRVAKDILKTETFEYGRDWILNDIDDNNFSITIYGKTRKFKKSKTLFEKFQTINFATALATLYKLENDNKIKLNNKIFKLDNKLLQKAINNTKVFGRPQRVIKGNYKNFFGKNIDIIYGVVKLNKTGIDSLENIIKKNLNYNNYFVYTSGNENALNSHQMYFFDFIKERQERYKDKLVIYRKKPIIYEKIKDNLKSRNIKFTEKNMLSQALLYVKKLIKSEKNDIEKNRIFILCDSMKNFDRNIVFLNENSIL